MNKNCHITKITMYPNPFKTVPSNFNDITILVTQFCALNKEKLLLVPYQELTSCSYLLFEEPKNTKRAMKTIHDMFICSFYECQKFLIKEEDIQAIIASFCMGGFLAFADLIETGRNTYQYDIDLF